MMHFAVVDANDGAILWYHNNIPNQGWDPENQKQLALLVRSVVGPFPDSLFKKKNIKEKISKKEQPVSGAPETKGAAVVATAGAN
jgi:hypothetical protein